MKYLIHSSNKRINYVRNYLIPSMLKQGIRESEIILFNDEIGLGNLTSFLSSCNYIKNNYPNEGIWHLQDDIIISSEFRKKSIEYTKNYDIVCTYVCENFNKELLDKVERQPIENIWLSFPCIYIKANITTAFLKWIENEILKKQRFLKYYNTNKMDDFIFCNFLQETRPVYYIYNSNDGIVEHIDYLLGGTSIKNKKHKNIKNLNYYFKENDLLKYWEDILK